MNERSASKLINGEVQLTPEVAVRLEMVLGVQAKFWNNLEAIVLATSFADFIFFL